VTIGPKKYSLLLESKLSAFPSGIANEKISSHSV